jgi:pimeloyl-ACP methyl ester carboxylesterase
VVVSGATSAASTMARTFLRAAEQRGVVLVAPDFASGRYADHACLGRLGHGERADLALDRIVDEVGRALRLDASSFFLFGHGVGADFAHRYLLARPSRVRAAVVASANTYSLPDRGLEFPRGIMRVPDLPRVDFPIRDALQVPLLVTVGERDVERDRMLPKSPELDEEQGRNRVERAERWVKSMSRAARDHELRTQVSFQKLPGVGHSFVRCASDGELATRAVEFLMRPRRRAPMPLPRGFHPMF